MLYMAFDALEFCFVLTLIAFKLMNPEFFAVNNEQIWQVQIRWDIPLCTSACKFWDRRCKSLNIQSPEAGSFVQGHMTAKGISAEKPGALFLPVNKIEALKGTKDWQALYSKLTIHKWVNEMKAHNRPEGSLHIAAALQALQKTSLHYGWLLQLRYKVTKEWAQGEW